MEGVELNRYLGDGVYASFDGYQIVLAANHHTNKVIYLEPEVYAALVKYHEDLVKELERRRTQGFNIDATP